MTKFRTVAVFAPTFSPAYLGGGPIRTLDVLVRASPRGVRVFVLTSDRDVGRGPRLSVEANKWVERDAASVYYMSTNRLLGVWWGFSAVRRTVPDLLYFNSFFSVLFSVIPQLLYRVTFGTGPQRLLAPRGQFSPGALAIKSRKKMFFIRCYRALRLDRGLVWHASSELEATDIRGVWGRDSTIVIRENETSLPSNATAPTTNESERLKAIFLGRIVPKKGLLVILEALKSTRASVQLDIFGGEEDVGYARACHRMAAKVAANVSVEFKGSVPHHEVRSRFNAYDVMLMPTAGENFGHVIAEALSASCPVMCTPTTPWTGLLEEGAGKVVPSLGANDWRAAIDAYAGLATEERLAMRLAAGRLYERWRAEPKGPHVFELLETIAASTRQ